MTSESSNAENRNATGIQARRSLGGHCAIERCAQPSYSTLPVCEDHAWDVWAEMNAHRDSLAEMAAAEGNRREWVNERITKDKAKMEAKHAGTDRTEPGTIYYLQLHGHVKIGYTTNLAVRIASYPPMATLVATHPGTQRLETDMHTKFRQYLSHGREWFYRVPELESHIDTVKKQFKQDARVTA